MVEQIAKLTEAQQLYQDAISLKEREFSVRTSCLLLLLLLFNGCSVYLTNLI